jgi:hypothetical protein
LIAPLVSGLGRDDLLDTYLLDLGAAAGFPLLVEPRPRDPVRLSELRHREGAARAVTRGTVLEGHDDVSPCDMR